MPFLKIGVPRCCAVEVVPCFTTFGERWEAPAIEVRGVVLLAFGSDAFFVKEEVAKLHVRKASAKPGDARFIASAIRLRVEQAVG